MRIRQTGTPADGAIRADREVARTRAYGFGHYDSRGGYTLIRATRMADALREYAEIGWGEDAIPTEWNEGTPAGPPRTFGDVAAEEDLDWSGILIFCDGVPEPGELLGTYDPNIETPKGEWGHEEEHQWRIAQGWRIGRVEERGRYIGTEQEWSDTGVRVIWKGEPPALRWEQLIHPEFGPIMGRKPEELRLEEETEEIGEDAWGCVLQ